MNDSWGHCAKGHKKDKEKHLYHLYVESKTEQDKNIKLIEQLIEKWLPEAMDAGEIETGW